MKTSYSAPLPPARIGFFQTWRWTRLGKKDAKKYGALLDITQTHALIEAVNYCRAGQHEVNRWLVKAVEPETVGNERILVILESGDDKVRELRANANTGRSKRATGEEVNRLIDLLANSQAQYRANSAVIKNKTLVAEQALGAWDKYYQQLAAIYTRARARAAKQDISSVQAEIPAMDSIPLLDIDVAEFEMKLPRKSRK